MRSTSRFLAAAVALCAALPPPLSAQSDEEVMKRYRLTEAGLARFTQASRNLIAAAKANPALFKERTGDDEETVETIAEIAALYDKYPPARRAITSAGLTTREYAIFLMSMAMAGMGALLVEQQQGKFDNLPAEVPRENVLFYQRHKAELQRISDELRALEGREPEETPPA